MWVSVELLVAVSVTPGDRSQNMINLKWQVGRSFLKKVLSQQLVKRKQISTIQNISSWITIINKCLHLYTVNCFGCLPVSSKLI